MAHLILKFGGTSIANLELMRNAAKIVIKEHKYANDVVVVVSAMGAQTDELINLLREACPNPTRRELDVIAHTGELVSSALFASVLQAAGLPARSISGALAGIKTNNAHGNARINEIDTEFLRKIIQQGEIPVVAGYQGMNEFGEITTLGRGGSDTTAAALGVALEATECHIYTDVRGVFTADPRVCDSARQLDTIYFKEMLELAALGTKVLHPRAVEFAGRNKLKLRVLSAFDSSNQGTLILFNQEAIMENPTVTGIAYNKEEAKVTFRNVPDQPGIAARIFSAIADQDIDVDVIVQNVSRDNNETDISFTIHRTQLEPTLKCATELTRQLGVAAVEHKTDIAKVSMVGVGMRGHAGIAGKMFTSLANAGINIQMISTSEIKISAIIDENKVADAVCALHDTFKLEAKEEFGAANPAPKKTGGV